MLVEKYMNETAYKWKKHTEFEKDGIRWVILSEVNSNGEEGDWYALGEDGEKVFNDKHETVYDKNGNIYE